MTPAHSQDIYRTLLENLTDGVMVVDVDGTVRLANPVLCRIFGFKPDEMVERPFGEIFVTTEGFDDFVEIVLDAITEQGDIKRRVVSVRIGEEFRSLAVTTSYLLTNEPAQAGQAAVIAVVADISEIRELRETELRMAKVVENQLAELQKAYQDIEARNQELSQMMKRVQAARGVAALLVVGVFLAIGAWYVQPLNPSGAAAAPAARSAARTEDPGKLPTVVVAPGELRSTIALRGRLTPGRVVKVVSPIDSHVSTVHANHGERVAAGNPLVDLDAGRLAVEHRQAQVVYIQARDKLAELEDWDNSADVARARRALRRAGIALDDAGRKLRETGFLLEQGIIPAAEHEGAQQSHQNRQLDFEEAERELAAVKAKGGAEARRVARLEVENAQGRVRALEEKLRQVALTAPIPGIIIAADSPGDKPLARGRPVAQGELLLSIADHEQIAVVTSVDEVDVRKVKVGQRATITGPGFPDLEIAGGVTYVSARANDNARQRNTSQFEVIVALDPLEAAARARLRVGMSAYITIVVHNNPGALLAPLAAVESAGGEAWVRVIDPDTRAPERRAVKLGLTTLDSVEVVAGLAAGEEIVLTQK